ncbi:MAG: protease pro-enzyme activation domain-containing protein [Terracidiphilus sp.]
MANPRLLSLCAVASILLCSTAALAQQPAIKAAPSVRITSPIDESQLVTLRGTVHPLANARNDRGAAADGMALNRLHLVLKRSPSQETALRELIQEQNTPGSAYYHKWLTPAQFGAQFGPSDQDVSTVENWLSGQGFNVLKVEPGKQTLEVSGSVGDLRSAFHTQIHKYLVNGEMHYANANAVQVPAALAPVVGGFVSLNNFRPRSYAEKLGEASYNPATGRAKPSWTIGSGSFDYQTYNFVLSPADFAVQYDLNPLYNEGINGAGQTIAIINDSNINIGLVNQFRTLFNLPTNPPQVIIDGNDPGVDGINDPDGPNYDSVEAYLDVEWSGAVAPDATVDLVVAADTSLETGLILAAEHAVYGDIAPVISLSFGYCESGLGSENAFLEALWEQAAAQGQTVMVSAGDSGSAGCDNDNSQYYAVEGQAVNGFASTPYNVAVGGTDFYYSSYGSNNDATINSQLESDWNTTASNSAATASLKGYIQEQPWNDSQFGQNLFSVYTDTDDQQTSIAGGSGGASNAAVCSSSYDATTGACSGTLSGYAKPSWQSGTGVPKDGVRDIPDVSLFSANGYNDSYYAICATDGDCQPVPSPGTVQIYGVGGTSASSPSFAGIMALVDQKYGPQGQADTILYPLAAQFPAAFHDVIVGTNAVPCAYSSTPADDSPDCIAAQPSSFGYTIDDPNYGEANEGEIGTGTAAEYNATTGYDLATGLGTVDAAVLLDDWGNVKLGSSTTTLTATPASITVGSAVSLSGTVTGSSPTGNVAIMTDSTEPMQQGRMNYALSSGSYSGSLSTLPGGSYNIWASYGGDSSNAPSVSAKVPITVNPAASGIALNVFENGSSSSFNASQTGTIDYGTQLMLSAEVGPTADLSALQTCVIDQFNYETCPTQNFPTATGAVTFADNGSAINTAVINAEGDAEYNPPFAVGAHSVTASYPGDNSYNASSTTASPIAFTVAKDTPTIDIYSAAEDSSGNFYNGPGQPTVVTVLIDNTAQATSSYLAVPVLAPSGNITVTSSPSVSGLSGTVALQSGVDPNTGAVAGIASFVVPATNGTYNNNYNLSITYNGDSNYNSASESVPQPILPTSNIGGVNSTTAVTSMSGSISPTTTLTIDGTVTGSGKTAPTGPVYVYASSGFETSAYLAPPSSGDISTFTLVLNSQTLIQGANYLSIEYFGDNTYNPSGVTVNSNAATQNPLTDFSIVPETTIVPVAAGSGAAGTDTLNIAATNGFSGAVTLTCAAPTWITCALSSATASLTGGSASVTVNLTAAASLANGNYSVTVTGTDPTGTYIHTAGMEADVTSSNASFTLGNTGNITVGQGATNNNTTTINVTPTNSFEGAVYLRCAVTTVPSNSTSPATCLITPSVSINSNTGAQTATLTVNTTSATTAGSYVVTVTGTAAGVTQTNPVDVTVSTAVNPAFAIAAATPAAVSPGSSTTSALTVTASNGYAGTVTFVCSLKTSPSGAQDPPGCTVSGTVTLTSSSASGTATATVTTTAASTSALVYPRIGRKISNGRGLAGAAGGALLSLLVFFGIPARRRKWLSMLGMFVVMVALGSLAGCGGGGSGGGGGGGGGGGTSNPGTTAGQYVFTVTGTGSPSVTPQPTQTFTVTVN